MKILESYKKIAKSMLTEQAWDRKFGEPLPTLEDVMAEADVMDKTIKFKDKDGNEKEATVGGILKKGEDHPAYDDAKQMADKGGEEEPKSKGLGKGDFERDFDDEEPEGGGDFTKSADYDMWSDEEPEGDEEPSGEPEGGEDIEPIENSKSLQRLAAKIEDKTNAPKGSFELQGKTTADDGTSIIQWKDKTDGMLMGVDGEGNVYEDGKKTSYKASSAFDSDDDYRAPGEPDWDDEDEEDDGKPEDGEEYGNTGVRAGSIADDEDAKEDAMDILQGQHGTFSNFKDDYPELFDALSNDDLEPEEKTKVFMHAMGETKSSQSRTGRELETVTINGQKYRPIKESVEPTIFDPKKHPLREMYEKIGGK